MVIFSFNPSREAIFAKDRLQYFVPCRVKYDSLTGFPNAVAGMMGRIKGVSECRFLYLSMIPAGARLLKKTLARGFRLVLYLPVGCADKPSLLVLS